MPCECVTARKFAAAFVADVRALASVEFRVTLEVVQAAEAGLAGLAEERLFVRVREEMRFEIVVASEGLVAVRTCVLATGSARSCGGEGCGRGLRREWGCGSGSAVLVLLKRLVRRVLSFGVQECRVSG